MSSRPNRPLKELVEDFDRAMDANDFDELCVAEKALDKLVFRRLRQMRYAGYPVSDLEHLLSTLPQDYNGVGIKLVMDKMDDKTPAQRAFCR